MKPIHRKRLSKATAKFDSLLKQVKHWKGRHPKSRGYYTKEESRTISRKSYPQNEHGTVVAPISMIQAARKLSPTAKLRCLKEEGWGAYGNHHSFKITFLAELGHHIK